MPVPDRGRVAIWRAQRGGVALVLAALLAPTCAHRPPRFDVTARPTCLVLSSGGTRGIAQLGALAAIREARLPISCVVGTSVGALVGGLYASAPEEDTTLRFRRLARGYLDETEREARTRGVQTSILLGTVAAALSGGVLAPAGAALGGYVLGAATVSRADRTRLLSALGAELKGKKIEDLPVPFASLHHQREKTGLRIVVDRAGDLAQAIGASIANPFIFDDVDVTTAAAIDPGSDRVAATPVEDACRLFEGRNLLVVNVSGTPAFTSAAMRCPTREIIVDVTAPPPEAFFQPGPPFDDAWRAGHDTVATALATGGRD